MPKEIINYPSYAKEHPLGLAFSIHWAANPPVGEGPQISVQFNVNTLAELLEKVRQNPVPDPRFPIYSEPLTREEMQRLIKVARRARDAAFGSDE